MYFTGLQGCRHFSGANCPNGLVSNRDFLHFPVAKMGKSASKLILNDPDGFIRFSFGQRLPHATNRPESRLQTGFRLLIPALIGFVEKLSPLGVANNPALSPPAQLLIIGHS